MPTCVKDDDVLGPHHSNRGLGAVQRGLTPPSAQNRQAQICSVRDHKLLHRQANSLMLFAAI